MLILIVCFLVSSRDIFTNSCLLCAVLLTYHRPGKVGVYTYYLHVGWNLGTVGLISLRNAQWPLLHNQQKETLCCREQVGSKAGTSSCALRAAPLPVWCGGNTEEPASSLEHLKMPPLEFLFCDLPLDLHVIIHSCEKQIVFFGVSGAGWTTQSFLLA